MANAAITAPCDVSWIFRSHANWRAERFSPAQRCRAPEHWRTQTWSRLCTLGSLVCSEEVPSGKREETSLRHAVMLHTGQQRADLLNLNRLKRWNFGEENGVLFMSMRSLLPGGSSGPQARPSGTWRWSAPWSAPSGPSPPRSRDESATVTTERRQLRHRCAKSDVIRVLVRVKKL